MNDQEEIMEKEIVVCKHLTIIRRYSQFELKVKENKEITIDTYINLKNTQYPKIKTQTIKYSCNCGNHIIFDLD